MADHLIGGFKISGLTRELAAENIRAALARWFSGTAEQHALIQASLIECDLVPPEVPEVEEPLA